MYLSKFVVEFISCCVLIEIILTEKIKNQSYASLIRILTSLWCNDFSFWNESHKCYEFFFLSKINICEFILKFNGHAERASYGDDILGKL